MNCPSFDMCSTPLCPDDPDIAQRIWYPDEPICGRPLAAIMAKNQRQLRHGQYHEFYTWEMLEDPRNGLNDPNQHGIDPSLPLGARTEAVKTWLIQNRGTLKPNKMGG